MDSNVIISIQSALLLVFLGIIGFFTRDLVQKLKELGDAISSLKLAVATESTRYAAFEKNCEISNQRIGDSLKKHDDALENHRVKLEKHSTAIEVLKRSIPVAGAPNVIHIGKNIEER